MATSPYESSSIGVRMQIESFLLRCTNKVGCQGSMALGVLDEERAVAVCAILLVRMVIGNDVLEASCVQAFGDGVKALLEVELPIFGRGVCLGSALAQARSTGASKFRRLTPGIHNQTLSTNAFISSFFQPAGNISQSLG
jgi:hypothetical protein